jgi:hypothetical protein
MLRRNEISIVTLTAALALLAACTSHQPSRSASRPVPVAWAFALLERYTPQDELDAREFGTAWHEVVRASLRCEAPEAAAEAAERITTWQRGVAYAELARAAADASDTATAARFLDRARDWRDATRLRHADDTLGWTVERINAAIALAERRLESRTTPPAPLSLDDPDLDPDTITRLVAAQPYVTVSNCLHEVTRLSESKPKALLGHYAEGVLDWTLAHPAVSHDEYSLLTNWITASLPIQYLSQHVPVLTRLSAVASRVGAEPRPWLDRATESARALPSGYLRAEALARIAQTLHPYDAEQSRMLFSDAEATAREAGWAGDAAQAHCRLAERLAAVGDASGADRCFDEAIRLVLTLENPSPRLRHASAVACVIASTRHSPSPTLATHIGSALNER